MTSLTKLPIHFASRDALIQHVKSISPQLTANDIQVSEFRGTSAAAQAGKSRVDAQKYSHTRNDLDGAVTQLSPYITANIITSAELLEQVFDEADSYKQSKRLVQQIAWRDYFQRVAAEYRDSDHPDALWHNFEDYKTGWQESDYAEELPDDIRSAKTPSAVMNFCITQLLETGYLHNRMRLYIASYVVHFRRVKWQSGAAWMLGHLLDGDEASNNLSWQWVASTFANKPYIFNLDNVRKFAGELSEQMNLSEESNPELAESYEGIAAKLFPHLDKQQES